MTRNINSFKINISFGKTTLKIMTNKEETSRKCYILSSLFIAKQIFQKSLPKTWVIDIEFFKSVNSLYKCHFHQYCSCFGISNDNLLTRHKHTCDVIFFLFALVRCTNNDNVQLVTNEGKGSENRLSVHN